MRIAVAQLAPELGASERNLGRNLERHLELAARAEAAGADLVVFPELSLTGYDLRERTSDVALAADDEALSTLAAASRGIDLLCGFVARGEDHRLFNACAYFAGGALRHLHRKVYLPTYGPFDEGRWFAPGDSIRAFTLDGEESRLARANGAARLRCGALVCEELWHPVVPLLLAHDGAQVLLALVAATDKGQREPDGTATGLATWEMLARTAALTSGAVVVLANRTGVEGNFRFFGSSFVVGPDGHVLGRALPYEEDLLVVEVDAGAVRRARTAYPLLRDERLELVARELRRLVRQRADA